MNPVLQQRCAIAKTQSACETTKAALPPHLRSGTGGRQPAALIKAGQRLLQSWLHLRRAILWSKGRGREEMGASRVHELLRPHPRPSYAHLMLSGLGLRTPLRPARNGRNDAQGTFCSAPAGCRCALRPLAHSRSLHGGYCLQRLTSGHPEAGPLLPPAAACQRCKMRRVFSTDPLTFRLRPGPRPVATAASVKSSCMQS